MINGINTYLFWASHVISTCFLVMSELFNSLAVLQKDHAISYLMRYKYNDENTNWQDVVIQNHHFITKIDNYVIYAPMNEG